MIQNKKPDLWDDLALRHEAKLYRRYRRRRSYWRAFGCLIRIVVYGWLILLVNWFLKTQL